MQTTFEKVSMLNLAFGNSKGDVHNPNVKALRKQAMLCLEEAVEMVEAAFPGRKITIQIDDDFIEDGVDMIGIMDAQGDLTTVNDGVAHVAGFNGNEVYDIVHASNMTKFISKEDDKIKALTYYYELGLPPDALMLVGNYPHKAIKVKYDIEVRGKFYPEGKFLKNMVTFSEPDFSNLIK